MIIVDDDGVMHKVISKTQYIDSLVAKLDYLQEQVHNLDRYEIYDDEDDYMLGVHNGYDECREDVILLIDKIVREVVEDGKCD